MVDNPDIIGGFDVGPLRAQIEIFGVAIMPDKQGRRLFIIRSDAIGSIPGGLKGSFPGEAEKIDGVLLAYENQGAYFWKFRERMDRFVLMGAGFSAMVAPTLAGILKRLFERDVLRVTGEAGGEPKVLIEGPKEGAATSKQRPRKGRKKT